MYTSGQNTQHRILPHPLLLPSPLLLLLRCPPQVVYGHLDDPEHQELQRGVSYLKLRPGARVFLEGVWGRGDGGGGGARVCFVVRVWRYCRGQCVGSAGQSKLDRTACWAQGAACCIMWRK
jgi:hypothetical protein